MTQPKGFRTATRRYQFLFWPMMIVYVAIILGASAFIDKDTAPLWLKTTGALAIALPLFGALFAVRRLTDETDEYSRLRHLRALRDGGMITAGILFLVGFLQVFDVTGEVPAVWFGVFYSAAYGLSACLQKFGRTV